jgi:hypothetical protein
MLYLFDLERTKFGILTLKKKIRFLLQTITYSVIYLKKPAQINEQVSIFEKYVISMISNRFNKFYSMFL